MTAAAEYEAYVRDAGGERCIRSILVANNGMAASKFIMSIRNWLFERFGDASLIRIVSMATSEDIRANAMHLHHADSFVEVPAGANFNNYANVEVIVRLARENRVDAVWPGVLVVCARCVADSRDAHPSPLPAARVGARVGEPGAAAGPRGQRHHLCRTH